MFELVNDDGPVARVSELGPPDMLSVEEFIVRLSTVMLPGRSTVAPGGPIVTPNVLLPLLLGAPLGVQLPGVLQEESPPDPVQPALIDEP
jgi:hypothetical protein